MFFSTIIPTIGRPSLNRAVLSILEQEVEGEFEIIVVNDSGEPLPTSAWQCSPRVKIIPTNKRGRNIARNSGAAMASGNYLHFLDEDDRLLPGAYHAIAELISRRNAAWYYGGFRFVDKDDQLIQAFHPDESGNCFLRFMLNEQLPLQVSFISTEVFFQIGGFPPNLKHENADSQLTRAVSFCGDISGIQDEIGAIHTGPERNSPLPETVSDVSRVSREVFLNSNGVLRRLFHSARTRRERAYWFGKILSIYLFSAADNFQTKNFSAALSRLLFMPVILARGFPYWMTRLYWRGTAKPHQVQGWLSTKGLVSP